MTYFTLEKAVEWLHNQPNGEQIIRDCYFDKDVVQASHRFWKSDEFQAALSILRGQGLLSSVLDLGAGRGIASWAFAKEGYDVTALEPDSSSVVGANAIRELVSRADVFIKIVGGYGERLPFHDETFDVVYVRQVLHHARDLKKLSKEAHRTLKPGGLFLVTREHVLSKEADLDIFRKNHPLHHLTGDECALLLSEYLEAITDSGFDLKNIWGSYDSIINHFPYTLAQVKDMSSTVLKPYIPGKILRPFMEFPPIFRLGRRRLSRNDDTPGRLYSFLALKRAPADQSEEQGGYNRQRRP